MALSDQADPNSEANRVHALGNNPTGDVNQFQQYQQWMQQMQQMVNSGQLAPTPQMPGSATNNPYSIDYRQMPSEVAAGTNPMPFYSMLDSNGNLKAPYANDPSKSQAFSQMKGVAESADLSPWASLQMQQNTLASQNQRESLNAQTQGQTDQAMSKLMSTGGGTGSGGAAFLASQGAKNDVMGNQEIARQEQANALGIQQTDAQNKQNLLGQVANTETGAAAANAATAAGDTQNANIFSANRYNQLMAAYGAKQTAEGQRAAGGGGKK